MCCPSATLPEAEGDADRAAIRATAARVLRDLLEEALRKDGTWDAYADIDLPLVGVLACMERVGAAIDVPLLETLGREAQAEVDDLTAKIYELAGESFNLGSPKQLARILFEVLELPPVKKNQRGYSTDAKVLTELSAIHPLPDLILRYREFSKIKTTYIDALPRMRGLDGRVHTQFNETITTTGRLSSSDPNLQNIPNRNAAGREIRSGFVPGLGYEALLSADYSQVELRIMADLSGDEALIEAFKSGADFHKYVASLVFAKPVDDVSASERSRVKAMSYGLAYGLSTYGLSQQLGIGVSEANALKNQYFQTFGKVHDYLESLVADARRTGYTETIFGRRRYFPQLTSASRNARDAAERGALNAPIQGSAADIMKIAMIRADRALREHGLASRIVLQIHDELVVELAPGEIDEATELVKDAMEHAVDLAVPLDVSTGIGADWQRAAH